LIIIAIYNIKGGVGKTASAANLSFLAAKEKKGTLLCDLDPQGSATYYFRIRPHKKFSSKKLLKGGTTLNKFIRATDFEYLDLLPAKMSHRKMDILLDKLPKSKKKFDSIFSGSLQDYEYIFLDCPPNITLVSENVFYAADFILIPLIPTTLSVLTYQKLLKFFKSHKLSEKKLIPFFSMVESRKKMHQEIVREYLKPETQFLQSQIPYNSEIEKMGIYRSPLVYYRPDSKAAKAYQTLWQEIKSLLLKKNINK
jgi:chromosome partitioning protein